LYLHGLDIRKSRAFNQIKAQFDHNIVVIPKDFGDLACDPFFHDLSVNLLHVHLLVEFRREFRRLQ